MLDYQKAILFVLYQKLYFYHQFHLKFLLILPQFRFATMRHKAVCGIRPLMVDKLSHMLPILHHHVFEIQYLYLISMFSFFFHSTAIVHQNHQEVLV